MIIANIPLVMFFSSGIFLPFVYNLKIVSVYQYVEERFGSIARLFVAIGFLATSTMLIGVMVLVPSLVIHALTGFGTTLISSIILVLAVIYTVMGGIKAVIWTDVSQMAVLWLGGVVVFFIVLTGIDMDITSGMRMLTDAGKLKALDFSLDWTLNNGVWVSIIGYGIVHLQYFSSDQSQVQRLFTARSMKDVKYSFWFSGIMLNTQFFIFMTLGLLLYLYYDARQFDDANFVMVDFIVYHVPVGIFGVIIAAVFAASMAAIDSLLNSMTTVYVKDFHENWFTRIPGQTASLKVSRLVTLTFGAATAVFVYWMGDDPKSPFVALMGEYVSYLTGSMLGIFIMGMFSRSTNQPGVCTGFIVGIVVVAVADQMLNFDWGWKAPLGLLATCAVAAIVSRLTGGERRSVEQYTYQGQRAELIREGRIEKDGIYLLPGKFEKRSYVLLVFFLFQFGFLYWLAN